MIRKEWISLGTRVPLLNSPHKLFESANARTLLTIQKPDAESFYISDTPAGHHLGTGSKTEMRACCSLITSRLYNPLNKSQKAE